MDKKTIKNQIIDYIRINRVSSTEVADCLGKAGAIPNIFPVNRGHFSVGPVRYIYAHSESNWPVHEQARQILPGDLVLIDGINVSERALIGELVCKYILLYQEAAGIVILGNVRDANNLIKENYSVWCKGFNPEGCFNHPVQLTPEVRKTIDLQYSLYDGAVAVCDDTGVVIVPAAQLTEEFLKSLHNIEEQEDIWFDCLDRRKWNTFDTVCLKKYLCGEN